MEWFGLAELNETRRFLSAAGTQTAGMVMAGSPNVPPSPNAKTGKTEQFLYNHINEYKFKKYNS